MRLAITVTPTTQPHTSLTMSKPNPTFPHATDAPTTSLPFNKSHLSWGRLNRDSRQCYNSPKLGHKWMQYQGINNWEGLLDPLDDNLRSEILRYGQFVEAAYRSFDFDTSSPSYATCRYSKRSLLTRSGMKRSGYQITKNLRVTCGVQLPKWVDTISQLSLVQSSWIGYVAVCQDKEEIARLGRRDIVIALRGTATWLEWLENFRANLTKLPYDMTGSSRSSSSRCDCESNNGLGCMVQNGFLSLYVSKTTKCPSLQEMVREEIARVIQTYGDEPLSLTITGHSLGAALAILSAYDITTTLKNAPMVTVVSFGGPRVGNDIFRNHLEQSGTRILRVVNSDDVITKVPGLVVNSDDVECNKGVHVGNLQNWFRRRMENMQLVYADVGQELRLSSRESPYLTKGNVATCHDLKTYLHLVNGFVSSSCPYMSKTTPSPAEAWL
ncbi:phospholipase A(1) DAD1, chloroplastic-like [Gastrolobium bilobum]|uniref:phospholipase A(1) DAD1, chloroplastic-like n=1 Tax=Gastrolobium bilobum TaxID=150636 RepID=UPI002AB29E05|nr:phospholipase A(1) DAD1, chloroplastic-like [Gastrolobium bilobum]